ncbi:MAG: putative lipoprotein [Labilithrix sp.]|nr:putative lipoprotein [Labilithrix sp.]
MSARGLVGREERRLRTAFQRALLLTVAGIGCGTTRIEEIVVPAEGGAPDASPADASVDAPQEAAPPDPCAATDFTPATPDTCGDYYRYPCGLPPDLTIRGDCYFSVNDCNALCPDIHYACRATEGYCSTNQGDAGVPLDGGAPDGGTQNGHVIPDEAGAVVIDCSVCPGSPGRVPAGLAPASATVAATRLGAYFAQAARLEAASVTAFLRLERELESLGAPRELCASAREAARDEARHTRAMARLARRHGGRYERPVVADVPVRSLLAVAEENVVEGCARETFSALLAAYQAEHAEDPDVARVMRGIADDEARHAALSWAIARWSFERLGPADRQRLAAAWQRAMDGVAEAVDPFAGTAALPGAAVREALVRELRPLGASLAA